VSEAIASEPSPHPCSWLNKYASRFHRERQGIPFTLRAIQGVAHGAAAMRFRGLLLLAMTLCASPGQGQSPTRVPTTVPTMGPTGSTGASWARKFGASGEDTATGSAVHSPLGVRVRGTPIQCGQGSPSDWTRGSVVTTGFCHRELCQHHPHRGQHRHINLRRLRLLCRAPGCLRGHGPMGHAVWGLFE
jgi:hypothetical protein